MTKHFIWFMILNVSTICLSQDYFNFYIVDSIKTSWRQKHDISKETIECFWIKDSSLIEKYTIKYNKAREIVEQYDSSMFGIYNTYFDYTSQGWCKKIYTLRDKLEGYVVRNQNKDSIFDKDRQLSRVIQYNYNSNKELESIHYSDNIGNKVKTTEFKRENDILIENQVNYLKDGSTKNLGFRYIFGKSKLTIISEGEKLFEIEFTDDFIPKTIKKNKNKLSDEYIYDENGRLKRIDIYSNGVLTKKYFYFFEINPGAKGL